MLPANLLPPQAHGKHADSFIIDLLSSAGKARPGWFRFLLFCGIDGTDLKGELWVLRVEAKPAFFAEC